MIFVYNKTCLCVSLQICNSDWEAHLRATITKVPPALVVAWMSQITSEILAKFSTVQF